MELLEKARQEFVDALHEALGFEVPDTSTLNFSDFGRKLTVIFPDKTERYITDLETIDKVRWAYKFFMEAHQVSEEEEELWNS